MLSYSDAAYVCFESYLGFLLLYVLVIPAALYHFSSGRHWHRRVDYDGVSHIPVCSACSSLLSIQSWPSSIPPAPSTALPTALPTALSTALPPLLHSTALIRSNRSSYRSYRRSIYINRCLYTFLNVLSLLHLTVRIGITTTGIAAIILLPNICYVHRSPFTVLVISDSPSLMYLLAISRFLLCRFYSQRSRVGFRSLLPLLGQLQLNVLYICLTMDHRISFSLPALPHCSSSTFAVYCRASAPRVASCLLFYWFLDSRPATSAAVVVYAFL
jgi:hypothetical protein